MADRKICDISIDYSVLTRKHLKITKQAENFYVQDLGSANKTFLNGEELKAGQSFPLRANDEISISDLKIVFEVRDRHFKQMMSNLPVLSQDNSQDARGSSRSGPPRRSFLKILPRMGRGRLTL